MEVVVYRSKYVFNVFLHKYFLNDYMIHIVEKKLQINGQEIFQKYQRFWYIFIITFLKGQTFMMNVDVVTRIPNEIVIIFLNDYGQNLAPQHIHQISCKSSYDTVAIRMYFLFIYPYPLS